MSYAFSHRGQRSGNEENTLLAFERAYQYRVRHFETDVRATCDGVVYAFHDETVERITAGRGRFNDHTAQEISMLRASGEPLCTLEALLNRFADVTFNIDVKDATVIAPLARVIEATASHQRIALASFDTARTTATAQLLSKPVRQSPGRAAMMRIWLWAHLWGSVPRKYAQAFWAVQVPPRYGFLPVTTKRFIGAVQRAGMQVHVWVINDEAQMRQLIARKVDAIMSDDVALLMRVLERTNPR